MGEEESEAKNGAAMEEEKDRAKADDDKGEGESRTSKIKEKVGEAAQAIKSAEAKEKSEEESAAAKIKDGKDAVAEDRGLVEAKLAKRKGEADLEDAHHDTELALEEAHKMKGKYYRELADTKAGLAKTTEEATYNAESELRTIHDDMEKDITRERAGAYKAEHDAKRDATMYDMKARREEELASRERSVAEREEESQHRK